MPSATNLVYIPHTTETLSHIATDVVRLLRAANETLGVAESLTAGGVMAAITSTPGASAVFRGGVVSYATELKRELLGVDAALIAREGVIHGEVAAQMAQGARRVTTTWGVGTTGVAGPDLQDGKPAGTVFIAVASPGGSRVFGPFKFPGSREQVREATVLEALARLRGELVASGEGKQDEGR
ncbi:putative competence/damage-inducible protein CinA [Thermothelomyces heterothallicus CBS 202.75]|uniref:putative competence/damage-inducible protein CinA n=1 Tax=Thermothelomyces heterothallicus CBS 202.75 TaxID=1149848 RepID=UPI003741F49C